MLWCRVVGNVLKWFSSFLDGRMQYVKAYGSESYMFAVRSGVPQGSHSSGPTLFNAVINIIPTVIQNVDIEFYADDAKFKLPINDEEHCVVFQSIASTFYDLNTRLGLELNVEK